MAEHHPDYLYGFNAGIQAAWERAMAMANALPMEPVTHGARVMRDAALDIADSILELKKRAPGEDASIYIQQRASE